MVPVLSVETVLRRPHREDSTSNVWYQREKMGGNKREAPPGDRAHNR